MAKKKKKESIFNMGSSSPKPTYMVIGELFTWDVNIL